MRLIKLCILRGEDLIREIPFKLGLNLILDSPTHSSTQSGNSVGKTTVLRLIDYCLGSDGDDIWQDSEFKKTNQEVFDFLHGTPSVSVELHAIDRQERPYAFKRHFTNGRNKTDLAFGINEEVYKSQKNYHVSVKRILFGTETQKPTLRQLVPKFVRSTATRMNNTLKFLGDYGSETDYEGVHLLLFGYFEVTILEERARFSKLKKQLTRDLQGLTRVRKEGEIEQLLLHLRREIIEDEQSSKLRGEVPEISARANVVSGIRSQATQVAASLGRIEADILTIKMTIKELEEEFSNIDSRVVESIYREAQQYVPKLHHDWKELSEFVINLRQRKQRFLKSQLESHENLAKKLASELEKLQSRESSELSAVSGSPAFLEALELRSNLQEKLKRLGSLEQNLHDIKSMRGRLADLEQKLEVTKLQIEEGKTLLHKRVGIFNTYFSELSKILYGEQYLLHFDETKNGNISFRLASVGTNVGAGKKVSQTAAFDLAYIQFLNETKINFPAFACHDGLEAIHGNQLAALMESADKINGQLIVSTLRDKLPAMSIELIAKNTILELSAEEKLFKIN